MIIYLSRRIVYFSGNVYSTKFPAFSQGANCPRRRTSFREIGVASAWRNQLRTPDTLGRLSTAPNGPSAFLRLDICELSVSPRRCETDGDRGQFPATRPPSRAVISSGMKKSDRSLPPERCGRVIACDLHDADVVADLTTAEGRAALVDGVTRLSGRRLYPVGSRLSRGDGAARALARSVSRSSRRSRGRTSLRGKLPDDGTDPQRRRRHRVPGARGRLAMMRVSSSRLYLPVKRFLESFGYSVRAR
jgi:hypothetical protein